jgi:hypothetical protein
VYDVVDASELWDKFLANLKSIKFVEHVDSFVFDQVQKLEVRFEGAIENTIIFKDHFLKCEKAQEVPLLLFQQLTSLEMDRIREQKV